MYECISREKHRCPIVELCMSVSHGTKQCPLTVDADPGLPIRLKAVESAVVSLASRSHGKALALAQSQQKFVVCGMRAIAVCKYRHPCSQCREAHPAIRCPIASKRREILRGDPQKGSPTGTAPVLFSRACRTSGSQGTLCWVFDSSCTCNQN